MAKRNAQGAGTIRKKTVKRNGKEYTYWEARYTVGRDPGTGKQIQRSVYGKSQKEVRQKLTAIVKDIDSGTYLPPQKMKLSDWLNIWLNEYAAHSVKPNTLLEYKVQIKNQIVPALGFVQLQALNTHSIQKLYNNLLAGSKDRPPLSPKTVRNCHGILHKALQQAVKLRYISFNPAASCELPRREKKQVQPLNESEIKRFLEALDGEPYKNLFIVALFTGARQGELLGLQWSAVNFAEGTITIDKQLIKIREKGGAYMLASTKTDNIRVITPAPTVMEALNDERIKQAGNNLKSYGAFNNPDNLVFTDELGKHLVARTVEKHFKKIVEKIGIPEKRFHDLRHTYATMALKSGNNIKDVQANLGHSTALTTLDLYSHVTTEMKKESAARMENLIRNVRGA